MGVPEKLPPLQKSQLCSHPHSRRVQHGMRIIPIWLMPHVATLPCRPLFRQAAAWRTATCLWAWLPAWWLFS